ncbi:transmembrane protein 200C-like [Aplochiton taeniatus]
MIATGGLLRMNRRQDSLRSKNRAENKRKRKAKKRKKNDVVVVKGKLNLCSPAGLVAAVGVVVLMVGITMAVMGYWPNHKQVYQEPHKPGANSKMSYSKSPPASSLNWTSNKHPLDQAKSVNESRSNGSASARPSSCGFFCDFLDRHLHSDNLKVFGPLVMGIGIFLFICANAVLHENRDKKTKIINLRDIYSTVIDLHSIRTKEYSPVNGLVNYTQAGSAEVPTGEHGASGALARSSWPSTGLGFPGELGPDELCRRRSWSRDVQTFTDTVYSIYRDHSSSTEQTPQPRQWETTSIVTSSVNAFTLPVIKLNNCEVEESEKGDAKGRAEEELVGIVGAERRVEDVQVSNSHSALMNTKETYPCVTDLPSPHDTQNAVASDAGEQQEAQNEPAQRPQMQLFPPSPVARAMGSRLSLNSLSEQPRSARRCSLSVSAGRQGDRARRFSCPRLERSNSKGYIKLADMGGDSFEASDTETSLLVPKQEVATAVAANAQKEEDLVTPSVSTEQ